MVETKKETKIVIIVMAVFIILLGSAIASLVMTQEYYHLEDYGCEDLDRALMEGTCIRRGCNWMSCGCFRLTDVYNHYQHRCEGQERIINLSDSIKLPVNYTTTSPLLNITDYYHAELNLTLLDKEKEEYNIR